MTGSFLDGGAPSAVSSGSCPQVAAGTGRKGTRGILVPSQQLHLDAPYTIELGAGAGSLTPRLDYPCASTV